MIISTLAVIVYMQPASPPGNTEDLRVLSGDLLNVIEYRSSLPGHPDMASVISSRADWNARSPWLEADVRSMLPKGTRFYLSTPLGAVGDLPPGDAPKHVRPFEAFTRETNSIVECKLIVWRG